MTSRWHAVRREVVLSNRSLTIESCDYEVDGRPVGQYVVVRRQPFVLIVAESQNGIIVVRQYRPGTDSFYWSLPAGYLEGTEDPCAAALRELLEETGAVGHSFRLVGTLDPLPGYVSSRAHIVSCRMENAEEHRPTDSEIDEVATRSWSEVAELIADGTINEMQAVAGLLLVRLLRERGAAQQAAAPDGRQD